MTEEQKAKYLDALRGHGYMTRAAREVGVTASAVRGERKRNPMFDKATHYYGWRGRGFCDLTAGVTPEDVQEIKSYIATLRRN
jgi:hypothetical protein